MACHCRRWSSEPSSAQILYQVCKLLQLLLHLLPLAVVIPLFLLGGLLQLRHPVFQRRNLSSTGAVLGALTTGRASCPFSFASDLVDPSVNTGGRAGGLDNCSLERWECVESHLISSTSSSFRPQAPDRPACGCTFWHLSSAMMAICTIMAAWWSNWSISSSQSSCSCNSASNRNRPLSLMNWHDARNQFIRRPDSPPPPTVNSGGAGIPHSRSAGSGFPSDHH